MIAFLGNIPITEDDLEMLEKLNTLNGVNGTMCIHDETMRGALRKQGLLSTNNIGWVWGTDRLRSILPQLRKAVAKQNKS